MSFISDLRDMAKDLRGIPGEIGMRPHRVFFRRVGFSGAFLGDGERLDTDTELLEGRGQSPKVRWLRADVLAVGGLPNGSCTVGPVTPSAMGGDVMDLFHSASLISGDVQQLMIVGPMHPLGALYRVVGKSMDKGLAWTLTASPLEELI